MPFPESPRVIYENNPLAEVICQLRFPSILRIDSEVPYRFQERVREEYPLFEENQGADVKLNLSPEVAKIIGSASPVSLRSGKSSYEFISDDGMRKVSLTRDFLALSVAKYERWENFKSNLNLPLNALVEEYSPAFYSRIGLRYKDIIRRSTLGMENESWAVLLKPHIAGELSSEDVAEDIDHAVREVGIRLSESSRVVIRHGLVQLREGDKVEDCYLIDSDFFIDQKMEISDASEILDVFHKQAGRLFRWCISDRLHDAMHPQPI
jgi:uncharacterized protein (TIGR04255 family)